MSDDLAALYAASEMGATSWRMEVGPTICEATYGWPGIEDYFGPVYTALARGGSRTIYVPSSRKQATAYANAKFLCALINAYRAGELQVTP